MAEAAPKTLTTNRPKRRSAVSKFTKSHEIAEHLSQKERLYRLLFFLSFSLNIIWILIAVLVLVWLTSPSSDATVINAGLKRYCDPSGKVAQYYTSLDTAGTGKNLWTRICQGPNILSDK